MDGNVVEFVTNKLQWLLDNPTTTWSGIGIYALSLTGSAVFAVAAYVCRRKKKPPTPNQFNNIGGEQNIAQGEKAIGKQTNIFMPPLKVGRLLIAAIVLVGTLSASLIFYRFVTVAPTAKRESPQIDQSILIIGNNNDVTHNPTVKVEDNTDTSKPCTDIDVGGVDLNEYCLQQYGVHAELEGKGPYDWRCATKILSLFGRSLLVNKHDISMNEACAMFYGKKTRAKIDNPKNPYSWRCIKCKQ